MSRSKLNLSQLFFQAPDDFRIRRSPNLLWRIASAISTSFMLALFTNFGPILEQGRAVVTCPLYFSFRLPVDTLSNSICGSRLRLSRGVVGISVRVLLWMRRFAWAISTARMTTFRTGLLPMQIHSITLMTPSSHHPSDRLKHNILPTCPGWQRNLLGLPLRLDRRLRTSGGSFQRCTSFWLFSSLDRILLHWISRALLASGMSAIGANLVMTIDCLAPVTGASNANPHEFLNPLARLLH